MPYIRLLLKLAGKKRAIKLNKTTTVIKRYGEELVAGIRHQLAKEKKNATGALSRSVKFKVSDKSDEGIIEFGISFGDNDYWEYVEKGVQGFLSSDKAPESPFKFGSGTGEAGGLRNSISDWVEVRGIEGWTTAAGNLMTKKQIVYVISRSIYLYGIEPTNYINPPFEAITAKFEPEIMNAFTEDVGDIIEDATFELIELEF